MHLRQSTASQAVVIGPFVDETDGVTAMTALTIANTDIRISKNGANIVAKNSGGGTHDEIGYYTITLDATDTNTVGRLQIMVAEATALPVYHEFEVLEEAVYDGIYAASAGALATAAALQTVDNEVGVIDGIVDDILVDTAVIGAAGAGLTAVPWNAAWDAQVESEVADALGVYDPPTTAEMNARTLAAADYATASALATVDSEIGVIDGNVDLILEDTGTTLPASLTTIDNEVGAIDTVVDAIKVTTDKVDDTLEDDAGTFRFTANALEEAPSGGGGGGDATEAKQDTIIAALVTVDGNVDLILADTNELQTDWVNGGRLDLILDARASQTSVDDLPTNAELATSQASADDATLAAIAALNNLSAAQAEAAADAALASYDPPTNAEMNARTLASASYATATALQTVDDEVGAIDTVVDGIRVDTEDIQARLPAVLTGAGNMPADMVAISGDATSADRLEALMDGLVIGQVNDAGATTTAFIADGFTEATDDHYIGRLITFLSGALTGQQTAITDYAGGTQTFTVEALTEPPANDSFFIIH